MCHFLSRRSARSRSRSPYSSSRHSRSRSRHRHSRSRSRPSSLSPSTLTFKTSLAAELSKQKKAKAAEAAAKAKNSSNTSTPTKSSTSAHQPSPKTNHSSRKGRPPSPPQPERGPRTPTSNQPQSPSDKTSKRTTDHQTSRDRDGKGKDDSVHRDRRKVLASGQSKDRERPTGPHNSTVSSLPFPQTVLEHMDKGERYGCVVVPVYIAFLCTFYAWLWRLTLSLSVSVSASFSTISLKESALLGKKKTERKVRQLLTDLPLPPELSGGTSSPHSPPEDKKSQTLRRRPKYVTVHLVQCHFLCSCLLYIHFSSTEMFSCIITRICGPRYGEIKETEIDWGKRCVDKFEIIGITGEGTYGQVYKAKDKDTGECCEDDFSSTV